MNDVTPQKQVAILLRDAANYLDKYGWGRGAAWNPRRRTLDLQGAIAVAAGARKERFLSAVDPFECIPSVRLPVALSAWESLDAYLGCDPMTWNDTVPTTRIAVILKLNALASLLDAGASFVTD